MNFMLGELESLFCDIQEIIEYFEQSDYDKRRFFLFLSNGDKINFRIYKESIAHLLGINTNHLISVGYFKSTNSFELLKELSDNAYRINKLAKEGIINYSELFSPYVINKVKSFRENMKINIFETEFICKYDSKKTYILNEKNQKYDYVIVKKYQNTNKYGMLCLVKNIDELNCVPMSNQSYDSIEDLNKALRDIITNQEITLINGVHVSNTIEDYNRKYQLPLDIKTNKLKNLREYKQMFNCIIDVSSDFEYSLQETMKHMDNHFDDNGIINEIAGFIRQGKVINIDTLRNTYLSNIVDSFNDFLCLDKTNIRNEAEVKYSDMKRELEELKKQLLDYQTQNKELIEKNENLTSLNEDLNNKNQMHEERNQKILELLKPSM